MSVASSSKMTLDHFGNAKNKKHTQINGFKRKKTAREERRRKDGIGLILRPNPKNDTSSSEHQALEDRVKIRIGLQKQRQELPIASARNPLVEEIRQNEVTVLLGETGSGKTTQVPQYLLEAGVSGEGVIAITQPRRVAATSLAARVAKEQGVRLGTRVGYSVRFDEKYDDETRIKYLTDGMMMRELMSDPLLLRYSVVIVDEAHERTIRSDLLLANLKDIQKKRNAGKSIRKLRIVIMSATLDAEKFSNFFNEAKILYIKGRQYPVKVYHTTVGQNDYIDSALRVFFQIHVDRPPGDVLVFLPGQEDIESLSKSIESYAKRLPPSAQSVDVLPMFASQANNQNLEAFRPSPPNTRKCILATNIAETSITIPGIKYVIDTGKHKEKRFVTGTIRGSGFDSLVTRDISQSSAMQRTGRAGRESGGLCFRLYTEEAFKALPATTEPEILRVGLTLPLLQLLAINQDMAKLELMDKPNEETLISAYKSLLILGAINRNREITPLGKQMVSFPLEPMHARTIMASRDHGCTREVLDITSILSASSKLFLDVPDEREALAEARLKFRHPSGDHMTILNVIRTFDQIEQSGNKSQRKAWCRQHFINEKVLNEAKSIREQLRQTCDRLKIDWKVSCGNEDEPVLRSLAEARSQNAALLQPDKSYRQIFGHATIKVHPGSVLGAGSLHPALIYDELVFTTQIYARTVSAISNSFLVKPSMS